MSKFILAVKRLFNVISFSAPTENPSEGQVAVYAENTESSALLMGVNSDGETVTLAEGTVVSE